MSGARRACLSQAPGRQRWHFQHGPIDLIIGLEGADAALDEAIATAWARFPDILPELVSELPLLRAAVSTAPEGLAGAPANPLRGPVARRMWQACRRFARDDGVFVTAMAAVAGSVAKEMLEQLWQPGLALAWVNNGGDIAWRSAQAARLFRVGIPELGDGARLSLAARDGAWGVATSGWRGRSQSLGIADNVTVLAADAALADTAATLIANAVSLGAEHPAVVRLPAGQVKDDSDLGERLVTVDVQPLPALLVGQALDAGLTHARRLQARADILGAVLCLQGQWRVCGAALEAFAGRQPVPKIGYKDGYSDERPFPEENP